MASKTTKQVHEEILSEKEILKGVPELMDASQFRAAEEAELTNLAIDMMQFISDDGTADTSDPVTLKGLTGFVKSAEEFCESIAVNRQEFIEWTRGLGFSRRVEVYGAVVQKFQRVLGE